jgi:poly-gamma-glutamate synthesis protein (capsule biosynthesis protein)
MEFEAGEQRMTPEMYEGFGLKRDALPSQMHMSRVTDASGKRIGFYAETRFSKSAIALCDFNGDDVQVKLLPIDLDLNRARPYERGVPAIPKPELGREIAADLERMSQYYGTTVRYNDADGTIAVAAE